MRKTIIEENEKIRTYVSFSEAHRLADKLNHDDPESIYAAFHDGRGYCVACYDKDTKDLLGVL